VPDTPTPQLLKKFIGELKDCLDVKQAADNLGLSEQEGKDLLGAMLGRLKSNARELVIHVDGASRGNPGQAGCGIFICDKEGRVVKKVRKKLGIATNNVAEYTALVTALEEAVGLGAHSVRIFADSELMVKQIKGQYRVKNEGLKPLYAKAISIIDGFEKFSITHVLRAKNKDADKLANEAIDGV
jgi:ribonuclease HI